MRWFTDQQTPHFPSLNLIGTSALLVADSDWPHFRQFCKWSRRARFRRWHTHNHIDADGGIKDVDARAGSATGQITKEATLARRQQEEE
jgi:hypothetical protein